MLTAFSTSLTGTPAAMSVFASIDLISDALAFTDSGICDTVSSTHFFAASETVRFISAAACANIARYLESLPACAGDKKQAIIATAIRNFIDFPFRILSGFVLDGLCMLDKEYLPVYMPLFPKAISYMLSNLWYR
jgi:hypothetical protein